MKSTAWVLALPLSLIAAGDLQAQIVVPYGGGYGGGVGFSYSRRNFSLSGFLGGFPPSRYGSGVYLIDPYGPPPVVIEKRIIIQYPGQMLPLPRAFLTPRPTLEEEVAGIDLDLVQPKSKRPEVLEPPRPAAPPRPLPGEDVSKPKPPLRPGDLPPAPKDKAPEVKPPAPKPPRLDPREENDRLVNLGLAAFREKEYGLAAQRFLQATLAEPKSARAYFLLAQAQFAVGKYRHAVATIHAGMRLHRNWPKAPFQPRTDLYKGIEPELAVQMKRLQGALTRNPDQPQFLFLHAYQLWFDGRQAAALPLFRRARPLTADPAFIDQFLAAAPPPLVAAK